MSGTAARLEPLSQSCPIRGSAGQTAPQLPRFLDEEKPIWDPRAQKRTRIREIAHLAGKAIERAEFADWGEALALMKAVRYLAIEAVQLEEKGGD